jgi:hypothetical protein
MLRAFRTKAVLFSLACLLTATALFLPRPSEALPDCQQYHERCTFTTGGVCRDTCRNGYVCRGDISGEMSCSYSIEDCCFGGER